jgi:hypothetical protein
LEGGTLIDRFNSKWKENKETGCHEWTAQKKTQGYGRFCFEGKRVGAHRVAWQLANGPIPDGLQLHHKCGNKGCVNPDHLEMVTQKQNMMKPDGGAALMIRQGKLAADIRKARGDYRTPTQVDAAKHHA